MADVVVDLADHDVRGMLMRILYLITRAEHGGAQSHLFHLAAEAARRGEVLVGIGEDGPLRQSLEGVGVATQILRHLRRRPHAWHDVAGVAEISGLIRRFDPDVVHAHSSKAGLLGRCSAAWEHVPSIYTAHGFAFAPGASFRRKSVAFAGEWFAGRLGDFTIAVSKSECRMGRSFGVTRPGKSTFIYNGVHPTSLRASPQVEPPVVTMVARFAYPKQQARLIRAFSRIDGDARLWLIGDGPALPEAQAEARRCGREQRITFWGDREDVPELLTRSQVGALISAHEGFGLSLIEAMSVGLPLLASDCGGMREVVVPGRNGLLVPLRDETSLTRALDELVENPGCRKRMGEYNLVDFQAKFTAQSMVERTFEMYDALLGGSGRIPSQHHCVVPCANCEQNFAVAGD
jgi:glycosyltransferase involved in cell wall biosynthesis